MPAKSRRKSEYHRHFRWKCNSDTKLTKVPAAGASPINSQQEPCFQSKKRLEGPASSLSSNDFANSNEIKDEYILLGRNDKFQHNIQYKCRTLKRVNTENDKKKNKQIQTTQLEKPQEVVDDYMLLGNNSKFIKNTVYKPKQCPEVMNVNGKPKDNSQMLEQPLSVLSNYGDEYMLLGSNAKFSDNIVYKPKMWREFNPSYGNGKENEPAEDTEDFQVQAKKLEPAPVVDTSKFREPPKKSKKSFEKADDSELKIKKKKKSSATQEGPKEDLRLSLDDLSSRKEPINEKMKAKRIPPNSSEVSEEKTVKFQSPPAAPRSPKEIDNDKRLLAFLHKAGIRLPPRSLMEQSEYQKSYTWKKPMPNSSCAENKKNFQTSTVLDKYVSLQDSIPRTTEYQRNFQAWVPLSSKPASPPTHVEKKTDQNEPNFQKKQKHPATKPPRIEKSSTSEPGSQVNDTAPGQELEEQPDSGPGICVDEVSNEIQVEDVKRRTNISLRNLAAKIKPPIFQSPNSEYSANFKAPSKYDYMNNVWSSAASSSEETQPKDNSSKGDWYSEVCDLRRKAAEYRRRANNTHFCADHVGQLLATETQLWERNKSDKPTTPEVDLKSMRPAGIIYNKHYLQRPKVSQNRLSPYDFDPEPEMTLEDVDDDDDDDDVACVHPEQEQEPDSNYVPTSSETEIVPAPPLEEDVEVSAQTEEDRKESSESPPGRIPTPELQQQHIKRHHLDRTTPTKGGLLISPAIDRKKIYTDRSNSPIVAVPVDDIKSSHPSPASDVEEKPKHCVKTCALPSKSNCQRTFGKPSKDTHPLRTEEELLSSTKPLSKASSERPAQMMSQDRSNITMRSGGNRRPKKSNTKLHPAGLVNKEIIPESMASTYRVLPERVYTDKHNTNDFLSQSLESNSSLASEILERTRKRLDFW